jgi:uncharacterized membrane protein YdjX (TVP38/TMEM64 family)
MRMDTECDLCFEGINAAHRQKIEFIRNDLIREHTGYEAADIQAATADGKNPSLFLQPLAHSTQHLFKINDRRFFGKTSPEFRLGITDPVKNVVPELPAPPAAHMPVRIATRQKLLALVLLFTLLSGAAILWNIGVMEDTALKDGFSSFLNAVRDAPLAIPLAILAYALAALFFAPVTVLSAVAVIAFGSSFGFFIALGGAMIAALTGYALGRSLGEDKIILLTRIASEKIKAFAHKTDITAVTLLRLVPLAPFTAVNLALGIAGIPALVYLAGTFFGFLPGTLVVVFLTGAFTSLWVNPGAGTIALAAFAIVSWVLLVWGAHMFHARWRRQGGAKNGAE